MNKINLAYALPFILLLFFGFKSMAQNLGKAPRVYTDNFKTVISKQGEVFDCSKDNLGVVVKLTKPMLKYDCIQVEYFGTYQGKSEGHMVAWREFYPATKEFSIKYSSLDSLIIMFMDKDTEGKEIARTGNIVASLKDCLCDSYWDNDYFFVIKGYIKTGEHKSMDSNGDVRMIDDYDDGTELSPQSVHFKGPEKKQKVSNNSSQESTNNTGKSEEKTEEKKDGSRLKKGLLSRIPR